MKDLHKFNKQQIQRSVVTVRIENFYNKHEFTINCNRIGFYAEFYSPKDKDYRANLYNYDHYVNDENSKLYKKYPYNVKKSEYKQWLKTNYK
jgi:hypothetical protein